MSNTLILDTSREFILLGLIKDDSYVFKRVDCDKNMSKYLMDELILFLEENNCKKYEISSICCGRGPGAFTGTRLALTIAKTMSYALKIELYSFSSIILYALFYDNLKVISIDDARSYKYYYGLINKETLEVFEGIDEDPDVVDFCDIREDFTTVSTREYVNITTTIIDNFEYFDLNVFYKILTLENHYTFKPTYIKKIN